MNLTEQFKQNKFGVLEQLGENSLDSTKTKSKGRWSGSHRR